jgi:hypothetical protein
VVIAKYYITLAGTPRRTVQYYRSARLALSKVGLSLGVCGAGRNPKTEYPSPKCASYIFQLKCYTASDASHRCAIPYHLVAFWSKKLDPVAL